MQLALFAGVLVIVFGGIAWLRGSSKRGTPEETRRVLAERSAWIAANRYAAALAFGGGMIVLTGAGMWAHAMLGETRDVDLAALERGEVAPESAFIRVHGHARGELAVCRETRGVRDCHVPLTSSPLGGATSVLVSTGSAVRGEGDFVGMVWADDVWGRDEIAEQGLAVSPGAFVLLRGETPEERRPIGLVIAAVGALLCAAGTFLLRSAAPFPR